MPRNACNEFGSICRIFLFRVPFSLCVTIQKIKKLHFLLMWVIIYLYEHGKQEIHIINFKVDPVAESLCLRDSW